MGLGCGKDEDDVLGGLFYSFQECVEGAQGEHVDFVYDVNLVARRSWREENFLFDGAYVVDAGVAGAVYFYDVQTAAFGNASAVIAYATGGSGGAVDAV